MPNSGRHKSDRRLRRATLFFSEAVESDDLAATRRLFGLFAFWCGCRRSRAGGRRISRGRGWIGRRSLFLGYGLLRIGRCRSLFSFDDLFELQAELHRGIKKAIDGFKRHREALWNSTERKSYLEFVFTDFQIPELMLEDDGHLVRVLRAQPVRHVHTVGFCVERYVEMMVPRQAFLGRVGEHAADHAA